MYRFLIIQSVIQLAAAIIGNIRTIIGIIVLLIIGRFGYLLYIHDMDIDLAFKGITQTLSTSFKWFKVKWNTMMDWF